MVERMSKTLTVWWPAAARVRLSGEMHRRLTWESGCWMVREQMPERASQNLAAGRVSGVMPGQLRLDPTRVGGTVTYLIVWS